MKKFLKRIPKQLKKFSKYIKDEFLKIGIITFILVVIGLIFAYPTFKEWLDSKKLPNINGKWKITFLIEKSSYNPYIGMKVGYNAFLNSDKTKFTGKGEKWSVNNEDLDYSLHDKISFEGTLSENKLYGIYTLEGKNRNTNGQIDVKMNELGKSFSGKFYGNGADASGLVFGEKQ